MLRTEHVKNDEMLDQAFQIRKIVFVDEQQVPLEEEIDEFENSAEHFVLYDNDLPVAAGRFRSVDGAGKMERICVLSSYRGKGAGQRLMIDMESFAREAGYSTLKLNAQVQAIPFYERLGYAVVSEEFMDAGIPHKTMKKTLS